MIFHSDIDECVQGLAGCNQNCTNTAGSYYCACMDGYELEADNHTCTGDDCNWDSVYITTWYNICLNQIILVRNTVAWNQLVLCNTLYRWIKGKFYD